MKCHKPNVSKDYFSNSAKYLSLNDCPTNSIGLCLNQVRQSTWIGKRKREIKNLN